MNISEIKKLLQSENIDPPLLEQLRKDTRLGVQKLVASYDKKIEKKQLLKEQYKQKSRYEEECYKRGYTYICGTDEVGRGPIAGPVVAAAVILKKDSYFEGFTP